MDSRIDRPGSKDQDDDKNVQFSGRTSTREEDKERRSEDNSNIQLRRSSVRFPPELHQESYNEQQDEDDFAPSLLRDLNISHVWRDGSVRFEEEIEDEGADGLDESTFVEHLIEDLKKPFFRDGKRRIDWILVYEKFDTQEHRDKRTSFMHHLGMEGLHLEIEPGKVLKNKMFVKVHAPLKVLCEYAKILNIKVAFKETAVHDSPSQGTFFQSLISQAIGVGATPAVLRVPYNEDLARKLLNKNMTMCFTDPIRLNIVWHIFWRSRWGKDRQNIGLPRLLNHHTFVAAYPLHDGEYDKDPVSGPLPERRMLYTSWASPRVFYRTQPLDRVAHYLGEEVALYFAWLGCYTAMLVPASIIGTLCFFYGVFTTSSSMALPSVEMCETDLILCPACRDHTLCDYQHLSDSCEIAGLSYIIDNPVTIIFAVFMSFWSTVFMIFWRRQEAILVWRWDLRTAQLSEEIRPEFEASTDRRRMNPVLDVMEPYIPWWQQTARIVSAAACMGLVIVALMGAYIGLIVYKQKMTFSFEQADDAHIMKNSIILSTITTAISTLLIIAALHQMYGWIASYLTDMENPRTQSKYESSFIMKAYMFEFVNCYFMLFYMAFFKGRFYTHPGNDYMDSVGLGYDPCDPTGCLTEIFIQLSIIVVGKKLLFNFIDIYKPKFKKWWSSREELNTKVMPCWERDFMLDSGKKLPLLEEHLEMVLQYGFMAMFITAFPLAPLCVLLINIAGIRIDAYKFLAKRRRPLPRKVGGIGAWGLILRGITYFAVATNAFMIASTSEIIPRLMYFYENNHSLAGYINSSLSVFRVKDHTFIPGPHEHETCRYPGLRHPPDHPNKYEVTPKYFDVVVARTIFVIAFEHIVLLLTALVSLIIPAVPQSVKELMMKEHRDAIQARRASS